jgi:alpha-galactosidase
MIGRAPAGLRPPLWWGLERDYSNEFEDLSTGRPPRFRAAGDQIGVEVPGSVLLATGLIDAPVNPDHTVIYLVDAVD